MCPDLVSQDSCKIHPFEPLSWLARRLARSYHARLGPEGSPLNFVVVVFGFSVYVYRTSRSIPDIIFDI